MSLFTCFRLAAPCVYDVPLSLSLWGLSVWLGLLKAWGFLGSSSSYMAVGIQEAESKGFQAIQRSGTALLPPYVFPPQWKFIWPSLFLWLRLSSSSYSFNSCLFSFSKSFSVTYFKMNFISVSSSPWEFRPYLHISLCVMDIYYFLNVHHWDPSFLLVIQIFKVIFPFIEIFECFSRLLQNKLC